MLIGDYEVPHPDRVGQAEYRCLFELLDEVMPSLGEENELANAVAVLEDVKEWCDKLIASIKAAAT